ncbi:helix-turn-helix transcriptional regulator [Amycolatopsis suaedae]|uniref:LuxR family transcriptional regulator n=1 Tax=Amycolatopsis suaedae TaxID=2510978 RepID=A0A4V2ELE3_9PSEU|nr:helix-turn-helix transcriptional regulator [Amycolatopsis suaedae]RZQ61265.1 LuxR family transcriptional regulator [Amycolatopsis suaedae]
MLPAEDFRSLFQVLEVAAACAHRECFFDEVRQAVACHLGWRNSLIVDVHGNLPVSAVDRHPAGDGAANLMQGVVDGGTGGRALLVVYHGETAGVSRRDQLLLSLLCRHLGPWLANHRAPPAPDRSMLSPRERQVADLVAAGLTNREIADQLYVSVDTVKKHLTGAMAKLGVRNRTQLALRSR